MRIKYKHDWAKRYETKKKKQLFEILIWWAVFSSQETVEIKIASIFFIIELLPKFYHLFYNTIIYTYINIFYVKYFI